MRFAIALVLVALVAAQAAVPFKNCAASSTLTGLSVDITPYPIQKNVVFTIGLTGQLTSQVTSGKYAVSVKFSGIPVYSTSGDLCTYSPSFSCPAQPGAITVTASETIPSIAPSGSYEIQISAVDQDKNTIFCADVSTSISAPLKDGTGACNNTGDLSVFQAHQADFHSILQACASSCLGGAACSATCLANKIGLTSACATCFGADVACSASACASVCFLNPSSQQCTDCSNQHCLQPLVQCAGVDPSVLPH